jgi:hypothetical protein
LLKFRLLKCQAERDIQADIEELENEPQRAAQIAVNRLLGYHDPDLKSKTTKSNGWVSKINRPVLKEDDGFLPHIPGEREEREKEERERDRLVVPKIRTVPCPVRHPLAKPYPSSGFGKKSRKIQPSTQTSVRLKIYKSTPEMQKEKIDFWDQEFKHIHSINKIRLKGPYRLRVAFLKKEEVFLNTDYDEEGSDYDEEVSYNTTKGTHVYDILKQIRHKRKLKGQLKALTSVITGDKILSDAEAKELRRKYVALTSVITGDKILSNAEAKELRRYFAFLEEEDDHVGSFELSAGTTTGTPTGTAAGTAAVSDGSATDSSDWNIEYRKFIRWSCSMSIKRDRWLNPNSILKATTISTPDYKTVEHWSEFCYGRDIPRDSVLRTLPQPPKIKSKALRPPPKYIPSMKFDVTNYASYRAFQRRQFLVRKKVEDGFEEERSLVLAPIEEDEQDEALLQQQQCQIVDPQDGVEMKMKSVQFFKQYTKKILHHSDMSKEQKDLLWESYLPEKDMWNYVFGGEHVVREGQLLLYAKFYDISQCAASIVREKVFGGRINTGLPASSMQHATSWAAIHWETYQDYNNEKSTITWKKNGTGKWVGLIQDAVYPEVIQALDFKLSESNYDARLRLVLKQTAEKYEEWKKKKLKKGTQLKIFDTDTDTDTNTDTDIDQNTDTGTNTLLQDYSDAVVVGAGGTTILQRLKSKQRRSTPFAIGSSHTNDATIGKTASKREQYLQNSRDLLRLSGFEDAIKSPISGNRMFYPKTVINPDLYCFTRLVMGDAKEEKDAPKFYCFLCNKEHNRGPGSSGQLGRHIKACTSSVTSSKEKTKRRIYGKR